jgi:hypothetical protein
MEKGYIARSKPVFRSKHLPHSSILKGEAKMKNLSKRSKTLLAIAGVVIVLVVAGLVLLGPGDDLFGTTVTGMRIQWSTNCLTPGKSTTMTVFYGPNYASGCTWSSNNPAAVTVSWNPGYGYTGYITGKALGVGYVTYTCTKGSGSMGMNVQASCGGGGGFR